MSTGYTAMETCPICLWSPTDVQVDFHTDQHRVTCIRCGYFHMDKKLVLSREVLGIDSVYLSAATRQNSENSTPLGLTLENWRGHAEHHANSSVATRTEKLLRAIAKKAGRPGQGWTFRPAYDHPLADAASPQEFEYYLEYLWDSKLISKSVEFSISSPEVTPTIAGWIATEPRSVAGGTPGRCFVAIWFDDSMRDPYELGFAKGIKDAGCEPVRIDQKQSNKGISDEIMAEIRRAQFTVADFTGQRQNVYFEAGFARGLGREVIWCCRKDHANKLHFDIGHLGHILWSDHAELRMKLANSIRANIIPKT